ncbi:hypothetical protein LTR64_007460 [Lithohypha guttulata]|uniref:uncharacterized protein n=1 Tax=Lithohypha guttulata TaxID=1690604 RepID=UPI002DE01813|nr:hypothetical protein LTR51_006774 [Lithohypha guttulata]
MICSSCRRTLLARISNLPTSSSSTLRHTSIRTISTHPANRAAAPGTPTSSTPSVAAETQPFSETFFPSTSSAQTPPLSSSTTKPNAANPIHLTSSIAGGTPLTTLSYVKQPTKPLVALEDHEYPPWLWTLIPNPNAPSTGNSIDGGIDVSSMTKKQRSKYERKMAKMLAGMEKPVPLHEQSKDLVEAEEGGVVFADRRRELTRSMREARRKEIREANFLRSM